VDVVDALDLGAIYDSYEGKDGRGQAAYDPAMMVRVLLYAYCTGSYSSRKFWKGTVSMPVAAPVCRGDYFLFARDLGQIPRRANCQHSLQFA